VDGDEERATTRISCYNKMESREVGYRTKLDLSGRAFLGSKNARIATNELFLRVKEGERAARIVAA